jgi:GH15 family glucan-1,4-alpha-glucosidase
VLGAGVAVLLAVSCGSPSVPDLAMSGIAERACTGAVYPVPVHLPRGDRFVPGSSVLTSDNGGSCVATAVGASMRWLADGTIPGRSTAARDLAARALLDLRLSVLPNGAVVAAYHTIWWYTWPRDSSWVAAALADAGHGDRALSILRFLQRMQPPSGIWAARYHPDGSGSVNDGRPAQLDSDGWVPWAVWCWAGTGQLAPGTAGWQALTGLWPMVVRAADAAAGSLTAAGLPGPAQDYWEHGKDVTLGTAAPLLAGLRAAADLADRLSTRNNAAGVAALRAEQARWSAAAGRLSAAITSRFGATGYRRTPSAGSGQDAAVTFLGAPFGRPDTAVVRAAGSAERALTLPDGGLEPGTAWPGAAGVAWTPETAMFALFDAGAGQRAEADRLLSWLTAHRTSLGELPEQVSPAGRPASVAPLAWTDAIVLLTLCAEDRALPVPLRRCSRLAVAEDRVGEGQVCLA